MRRLLVMMLMALSVTAVAPALTASPAFAAQARCTVGPFGSPWWWGNVNARIRTGTTKVLAVEPPYSEGSDAYLWGFNDENGQKWVHQCMGYDSVRGLNNWRLRYAADTYYCLDIVGSSAVLLPCNLGGSTQLWQRVSIGSYTALRNVDYSDSCLQPVGAGTANGTIVSMATCHYGDSQLWW